MSKKLLLADDSVTIQKVIEISFASEDYELTIVGNGDEALEKAKLNPPDLVLADIIMPGKNGYELCSEIKKAPELTQTPVLLLAGSFEPFDEEKARSVGADSWIAKPFESQVLVEKVKNLLENPPQPIQMPAAVPAPSLDEKEASLEEIIPLENSESLGLTEGEKVYEELPSEPVSFAEEELGTGEEDQIPEPALAEPESTVEIEPLPDIMGSPDVEFESPPAPGPSLVTEEPSPDVIQETPAIQTPPPIAKPAPAEAESQEAPEVTAFSPLEVDDEDEEILLLDENDIFVEEEDLVEEEALPEEEAVIEEETLAADQPVIEEETLAAEEAVFEEETLAAEEAVIEEETLAVEETVSEEEVMVEEETLAVEEDQGEENLWAAETAMAEEESATSEVTLDEELPLEKEEFFENLPESSFEIEPEEEDSGLVLHSKLGEFSIEDMDEGSSATEEVQTPDTPAAVESQSEPEEPEAESEFSFDDFEEDAEQETEISADMPEEPVAQEPPVIFPSMEEKPEAPKPEPTYAQMEQKVHSLTDAQLYSIVEKVAGATIEKMAKEILEQVAWEVVPNLSENIIKEEIQKIKAAQ